MTDGRHLMHPNLDRRKFMVRAATAASASCALGGWLSRLAAAAPADAPRPKSCILLWMAGGPSHIDTFDPKPDAKADVRGEFKPIDTSVPGIRVSEHFPKFAKLMKHAAVLRGMNTLEAEHTLATYHLHTGYQNRAGAVSFPSLGAIVAKELGKRNVPLPNFVSIGRAPQDALTAGFLGPDHQPLAVTDPVKGLDFIDPAGYPTEFGRQVDLVRQLEGV